jgi:hypothetical protein
MVYHFALLPRYSLCNLHQSQLHPRSNLIQPHRAPLPLLIVPTHIVPRKTHSRLRVVPRRTRRVARRSLVPIPSRPGLALPPEDKVRDVALVAEVEHPAPAAASRRRTRRRAREPLLGRGGRGALEHAPDAPRDAVRLDGDDVVPDVDRAPLGAVGDEHHAARGGERERLRAERREERLERLHEQREVRGCAWAGRWEGREDELPRPMSQMKSKIDLGRKRTYKWW